MPSNIKATREGLVGKKTSSGYVIDKYVPYVALPCVDALFRRVRVRNLVNGRESIAVVLDVGPWNERDRDYVLGTARPLAEVGEHVVYVNGVPQQKIEPEKVNGAGIDLGERVWAELRMQDNGLVDWEFVL
jgi:hypothetical protein